jgi:single-stranded-DNA-specific exonuclease
MELFGDHEKLEIDDTISPEEIDFELYRQLSVFEPTGPGNMAALFCISETTVVNPTSIGKDKNHLRFFIPARRSLIPVIGWGLADKGLRILEENELVDVVFSVEDNYYRGERSLQLVLADIRGSRPPA